MFRDRTDAGERLARKLGKFKNVENAVILAVPRGGLVIGSILAKALNLPLDIVLAKKIGHPLNPEYAIGAVTLSGEEVDSSLLEDEGIPREYVKTQARHIREALRRRYRQYRGDRKPLALKGKTVIVTDDGVATGYSLFAAIAFVRREEPAKIVVAVPVAAPSSLEKLGKVAEEVVCLSAPEDFMAIGRFYEDFSPIEDEEAARLLAESQPVK